MSLFDLGDDDLFFDLDAPAVLSGGPQSVAIHGAPSDEAVSVLDVTDPDDDGFVIGIGGVVPDSGDSAIAGGGVVPSSGAACPEISGGPSLKKRRRQTAPRATSLLEPRAAVDGTVDTLKVLFAKSSDPRSKLVPIPMWPLYTVSDDADSSYILVSYSEAWLHSLVDALRPTKATDTLRNHLKRVVVSLRSVFRAGLLECRQKAGRGALVDEGDIQDDLLDDVDADEKQTLTVRRVNLQNIKLLPVKVAGYSLKVFNTLRPIIVRVDDNALAFFRVYVMQLIVSHFTPPAPTPPHFPFVRFFFALGRKVS